MIEPNPESQNADVLSYVRRHGSITTWDAIQALGCTRLSARIEELEKDGWVFSAEWERGPSGKRYKRYRLVEMRVSDTALEEAGQLVIFP